MSFVLINNVINLAENYDLHLARILILMSELSGKNHTTKIRGITKIVKLDFLLRYPTMLEKTL